MKKFFTLLTLFFFYQSYSAIIDIATFEKKDDPEKTVTLLIDSDANLIPLNKHSVPVNINEADKYKLFCKKH